jgi:hypothetical protein
LNTEQLVEARLPKHGSQRRLRDLRRRLHEIIDANDRGLGVHDLEEDDRVHLDGHVVGGDHLLLRNLEGDDPEIDFSHVIDPHWEDEK